MGDVSGYISFEEEDVARVAFIAIGPRSLSAGARINCAVIRTRSPERWTVPSMIPSTLSSRAISGSAFSVFIVAYDRCARDHLHGANLRQICDQGISHAIREVFLRGISGKSLQRQHSQGMDRWNNARAAGSAYAESKQEDWYEDRGNRHCPDPPSASFVRNSPGARRLLNARS